MQIEWQIFPQKSWHVGAVVFFGFEETGKPLPGFDGFVKESGSWLVDTAALRDFQGKLNEIAVFYAPSGDAAIPRIILAGLGPRDGFESEKVRNAAAFAFRKCGELGIKSLGLPLCAFEGMPLEIATGLREALIGGLTGLHRFKELKTKNSDSLSEPTTVHILSEIPPDDALSDIAVLAEAEAAGIVLARDLTISPANRATPEFLADTARDQARRFGFRVEIIDRKSALSMGMGAFSAVAQGSQEPAYIVVIEHAPLGTGNDPPLVLAGKGITFDTGGISLKSRDKMEAMKQDMAGAAAVLGAFEIIGRMQLRKHVIGVLPCTENMPGGRAYKPGDVIRSYSGQTIEVISTDAEGRMVLCDVLAYAADRFGPSAMVDIATLTGACIIALGNLAAAVLGNREDYVNSIREIGGTVGEKFWPLPLWDPYFEAIKSDVADVKNVGDRSAGTIIGGIFLKQFVPGEIPWVHLDIAGTAWTEKDTGATPRGATGFGVRTLFEIARRWPLVAEQMEVE
jgi:leucyl aminopeptidase